MKARMKDPARRNNTYKLGRFNNKEALRKAFAEKLFVRPVAENKRWKVEMVSRSGNVSFRSFDTRQEAREKVASAKRESVIASVRLIDTKK